MVQIVVRILAPNAAIRIVVIQIAVTPNAVTLTVVQIVAQILAQF